MNNTAIVIPCFNEAQRLDPLVFSEYISKHPDICLIFVNDGSTDETQKVIEYISRDVHNAEAIHLPANHGKSEAVRKGFLWAFKKDFSFIGYWDADLSTPLGEIIEFRREIDERDCDVLMGSRVKLLGLDIQRKPVRHYFGRLSATLISTVLGLPIYDTQCGAKLFRNTPALERVFSKPFTVNWLFDVEIIARFIVLSNAGEYKPFQAVAAEKSLAVWRDVSGSKVSMTSFLQSLFHLMTIFRFLRSRHASDRFLATARLRAFQRHYSNSNCWVFLDDSERLRVKDISLGGICLNTLRKLSIGSQHDIKIVVNEKEIQSHGKVVWSLQAESVNTDNDKFTCYDSGFRFTEIHDDLRISLSN